MDDVYALRDSTGREIQIPRVGGCGELVPLPQLDFTFSDSGKAALWRLTNRDAGSNASQWVPVSQLTACEDGAFVRVAVPRWLGRKLGLTR